LVEVKGRTIKALFSASGAREWRIRPSLVDEGIWGKVQDGTHLVAIYDVLLRPGKVQRLGMTVGAIPNLADDDEKRSHDADLEFDRLG
jgi:hypothetical protein